MLDAGREDDSRKAREGRGDLEWREEKPRITRIGTDGELTTESTEDTEGKGASSFARWDYGVTGRAPIRNGMLDAGREDDSRKEREGRQGKRGGAGGAKAEG